MKTDAFNSFKIHQGYKTHSALWHEQFTALFEIWHVSGETSLFLDILKSAQSVSNERLDVWNDQHANTAHTCRYSITGQLFAATIIIYSVFLINLMFLNAQRDAQISNISCCVFLLDAVLRLLAVFLRSEDDRNRKSADLFAASSKSFCPRWPCDILFATTVHFPQRVLSSSRCRSVSAYLRAGLLFHMCSLR